MLVNEPMEVGNWQYTVSTSHELVLYCKLRISRNKSEVLFCTNEECISHTINKK